MNNINLDVNSKTLEACLKTVRNFGGIIYKNICNGSSTYVPWGSIDWMALIVLLVIFVFIIGILIKLFRFNI